jgi:hypothetical protein
MQVAKVKIQVAPMAMDVFSWVRREMLFTGYTTA